MHDSAGNVDEVGWAGDDRLFAEEDLELPRQEVVGLVLSGVDVGRWPAGRRHERLHRKVRAA